LNAITLTPGCSLNDGNGWIAVLRWNSHEWLGSAVTGRSSDEGNRRGWPMRHSRALRLSSYQQPAVAVSILYDPPKVGPDEVRKMSATPNSILASPEQRIADLERQLAECKAELAERAAELAEAREQHTATAEVLQVINSSPGELAPVFDAMLEKAMRLCEAPFGHLLRFDGKVFRWIAARDRSGAAAVLGDPVEPDPGSALERLVLGDEVVHIPDVVDTGAYRSGVPSRLKLVEIFGARTARAVLGR